MREFSQDLGESFVCFFPCHDEDSLYFLVIEDIVKTGSKMEGNVAHLSEAVLRHMPLVRFEISRLTSLRHLGWPVPGVQLTRTRSKVSRARRFLACTRK